MVVSDFKTEFYKRVYRYSLEIIKLVESLSKDQTSHILGSQLLRSGTSVTANIIEAKSASSKKDYINFYNHALKSANETKLWIMLLRDSAKIESRKAEEILRETVESSNILASSIMTMKGRSKV